MTKIKHANDLKSTYFEGDKIFLRAILINISFKPTFSGCLYPVSMHGVFHITNWIVYKQSYWVCSVYSFTYFADNVVDFSIYFLQSQASGLFIYFSIRFNIILTAESISIFKLFSFLLLCKENFP